MSMLSKLTRALYGAARMSNEARVIERAVTGHPETILKHERNRLLMKFVSRFMR